MKLNAYNKIHFIGIGGISMSSLAEILLNEGYTITGSDSSGSELTKALEAKGVRVMIGHNSKNVDDDVDLVVYTAAIAVDNLELAQANKMGIPAIDRAELVGLMMKEYKFPVSIAGTHGKTTTSSIISEIFLKAEAEPTISIGGILPSIGGNFRIGKRDYFVLETCEYRDSFLKFNPHSAIILNIELDHTDYFKDLNQVYYSFNTFARRIPSDGFVVINSDIKDYEKVLENIEGRAITYGRAKESDWYAENISYNEFGFGVYDAYHKGEKYATVELSVIGEHNIFNSLGAIALTAEYGIAKEAILEGVKSFTGTHRRFEKTGEYNGAQIYDDYAHHPTEIIATITGARKKSPERLIIAFQPHTYTRTMDLLDEFAKTLKEADEVLLLDIFAAREKDNGKVSSRDLERKLLEYGAKARYFESFDKAAEYARELLKEKDIFITMGAGDIYKLEKYITD